MNYNINHIVVLLGISVVIISFYLIFKKKENDSIEEYILASGNSNQEEINLSRDLFKEGNDKIVIEIEQLRKEVTNLTHVIQEVYLLLEEQKNDENLTVESNSENFNHLLNYNQFLNKNKPIIDLSKQNKTSEEIAKILNKSVREIEMVIKLIK
ncbi:hypothetical protein SAMN05446037_1001265 [Anaerovirgula multivorans]|uniref:Uncharacterized protein n=1 Tax=Anaerovirgula multivorans TaxID=312168 RepID=A0A239A2Y0_9FIRM|nr:hypothetical protein [Anaerovirgula multivorans]SNR89263.1 hypothetical protein SAMN05446037_1001265 [Anaerovirgula multivorans]